MSSFNLDSSDWQNFIYSLLILVAIISGFSFRYLSFAKIFKYSLFWIIFIIIAILLYSYRFEFEDLKQRFIGELNPSKPFVNQNGEIVINMSSDGHFYINIKINEKNIRFMVDTGASDVSLDLEDAKNIGIDLDQLNFSKEYKTANGTALGANIVLDQIQIDQFSFYNINASVNSKNIGISLLGMSFLRKLQKYEFRKNQLILTI
jgi:aspartyl protease family protein